MPILGEEAVTDSVYIQVRAFNHKRQKTTGTKHYTVHGVKLAEVLKVVQRAVQDLKDKRSGKGVSEQ